MRVVSAALASIGLAIVATAASANPFSDLTRSGDACFRRDYDAAHLKKHPRQRITSMTVWVTAGDAMRNGNTGIALTRRGEREPLFVSGDCAWDDFKSPPDWMTTFRKTAGAGCVTSAVPDVFPNVSSAEEGGAVILDPSRDGTSIVVHLDEGQVAVKRANRARTIALTLGADDRVFLLRRTGAKVCDFLKEALTAPEPAPR
jgi:hypothetical protein